jgi:hypothetical protein
MLEVPGAGRERRGRLGRFVRWVVEVIHPREQVAEDDTEGVSHHSGVLRLPTDAGYGLVEGTSVRSPDNASRANGGTR